MAPCRFPLSAASSCHIHGSLCLRNQITLLYPAALCLPNPKLLLGVGKRKSSYVVTQNWTCKPVLVSIAQCLNRSLARLYQNQTGHATLPTRHKPLQVPGCKRFIGKGLAHLQRDARKLKASISDIARTCHCQAVAWPS